MTGNGISDRSEVPARDAPSPVCFDKDMGKVLWTDASPKKNILRSHGADRSLLTFRSLTVTYLEVGIFRCILLALFVHGGRFSYS